MQDRQALSNHLYYSVQNTSPSSEHRRQLWQSVYNHIQDIHNHPDLPLVQKCSHDPMPATFTDAETGKTMTRYYINQGEATQALPHHHD